MANENRGKEEQMYYDKWSLMVDLKSAMTVAMIVGGIGTFLGVCMLATGKLGVIVLVCGAVVLAAAFVMRIVFGKLKGSYYDKYKALEKERLKQEALVKEEEERRKAEEKKQEKLKKQQEAKEKCAKEGHSWTKVEYKNEEFSYKPELFECLPVDCCNIEKCSCCGEERKTPMEGVAHFDVPNVLKSPILYKGKVVGDYELYLDVKKSYSMRAKKDMPSAQLNKGDMLLALQPKEPFYSTEERMLPERAKKQTDKIIDNGDMPGLVKFKKYIAFVDDDEHVICCSEITIERESEGFGVFTIGLLPIPSHGKLVSLCVIEE